MAPFLRSNRYHVSDVTDFCDRHLYLYYRNFEVVYFLYHSANFSADNIRVGHMICAHDQTAEVFRGGLCTSNSSDIGCFVGGGPNAY
jgi:hypothetical protein